ncbi:hypothetical protein BDQ12DRAFT_680778 [Crucibulum laeve]|uniref:F-box domain-containing protein n=1 Tax=Crucibulum laeve TaxID=68775 RepID=A0A5C3M6N3_9AGAR|nr:hypothetical protein BDQ12DRAFT_680778 [Crucibulum laeve]
MLTLLDLPQDVLLTIYASLSPQDILALKQTCRGLHAFGCVDYVWHQLKVDLPLDLPAIPELDVNAVPAATLQRSIMNALRLDDNWRRRQPCLKNMWKIPNSELIYQAQFVGTKLLVILSRNTRTINKIQAHLSVWRLPTSRCTQPLRIATIECVPGARFSLAIQKGGENALVIVFGAGVVSFKGVGIYSLNIQDAEDADLPDPDVLKLKAICPSPIEGIIGTTYMSGHMVAIMVARYPAGTRRYQILLINTLTNYKTILDIPRHYLEFNQMQLRLFPEAIAIITYNDRAPGIDISVRAFSAGILSTKIHPQSNLSSLSIPEEPWGEAISEYKLTSMPSFFDLCISPESATRADDKLSLMVFYRQPRGAPTIPWDGAIFRFPLSFKRQSKPIIISKPVHQFKLPRHTQPDIVCVGKTGHRGIWTERRWDSDEYWLKRVSIPLPGEEPVTGDLFSRDITLPFELYTIQSLWFEEATGRVVVALHTGDMFIIEL